MNSMARRDRAGLRHQLRDGRDGLVSGGEEAEQVDGRRRLGNEFENDLREDAEGALGADHQLLHRVAGDVLEELAAVLDDLAGGGHDFEPQDVSLGDAVLDGLPTAGVLGDVPADVASLEAHRVSGVEQTRAP